MDKPVPALDIPPGKQQEQVHSLKEDKLGLVGEHSSVAFPWKDQENKRLCWQSRDGQGKTSKQVQASSRKSNHKQQKMGLGTKLPTLQVSRFTQDVRLLRGAAWAWAEILPWIHGQWVPAWGCFEQLGHFSVLRTLSTPQSKMYMEIKKGRGGRGRESSTFWESSFRELRFYKQEWSNC